MISSHTGVSLSPADAARAWAQRAQCESDILHYLAMLRAICHALYSRARALWRRRRRVFALEYTRRWRGREMRAQWAARWQELRDSGATASSQGAPAKTDPTSTGVVAVSSVDTALVPAASVEAALAAQRRAAHVLVPLGEAVPAAAVEAYTPVSTMASALSDPACTVLLDSDGIMLPRKDDIRKTVASFRARISSRVERVRVQEQERDKYAEARRSGADATGLARVWWAELEQQRLREEEEKRRMGAIDISGDINYEGADQAQLADVEYDSDFDEEVTVGRQPTREERREVRRFQQGRWRAGDKSVFDVEHRRMRLDFKTESQLSEKQRTRARTRTQPPRDDVASVSKFGVHIALVEDENEDETAEALSADAQAAPATAFEDPRCPYLPPGQDPYLDDPYWLSPPAQDAGAVAEDGTRAATVEEVLLERVVQQLQPLLLWPSVALRQRAAEVNCLAVAALGICGRVWPELESSGGFSGTVLSVREIIRARKRAERAAQRKLQGLFEKKKNRFAGMVYGREGWQMDEEQPEDDSASDADETADASRPGFVAASGRGTQASTTNASDPAAAGEDDSTLPDVRELGEWDFYKNSEKSIFPEKIPEPPIPTQHDIRLMPVLSALWPSLRFLLSPQHATPARADADAAEAFNPTLPSALALLAVAVATSPTFLAARFAKELWPALQRLLLRCAALTLTAAASVDATGAYSHLHAQRQSYAGWFPPAHSATYRVLVLTLCALRHCLLTADTARPLAAAVLHTVLPFMAPHVPADVRALVASIVALVYVHDAATATALLYNVCLALGVPAQQLSSLATALTCEVTPAETASAATAPLNAKQRLARTYAAYNPPQPRCAASSTCPVNGLTQTALRDDNDATKLTAVGMVSLAPTSPWLRGYSVLAHTLLPAKLSSHASSANTRFPESYSANGEASNASGASHVSHVSLQVYRQLQRTCGRDRAAAGGTASTDEAEAPVRAAFISVLCVAELLAVLEQVKTGQLNPLGYYGSHL